MASTDAKPVPIKNTAFRVTFPIFDADGDLVTGASGLDSEISKDGGAFADCTNEATEIATSSGIYYLDLTADEMNADTVAIIVKTSTSGAKTTPMVFYPQESGDIKVDLESIKTQAVTCAAGVTVLASVGTAATMTAQTGDAYAIVNSGTHGNAALKTLIDAVDDYIDTEVAAIKTKTDYLPSITAGSAGGLFIAGANAATTVNITGNITGNVTGSVGSVTGNVTGSVGSVASGGITAASIATGAIDADALTADAVDAILDEAVEGSITLRQAIRGFLAVLAGKSAGGGSVTITFRDQADTKDRITATVDTDGNRSAVVLDLS